MRQPFQVINVPIVLGQGEAMDRPGVAEVTVDIDAGLPVGVRVGGSAVVAFETTLTVSQSTSIPRHLACAYSLYDSNAYGAKRSIIEPQPQPVGMKTCSVCVTN